MQRTKRQRRRKASWTRRSKQSNGYLIRTSRSCFIPSEAFHRPGTETNISLKPLPPPGGSARSQLDCVARNPAGQKLGTARLRLHACYTGRSRAAKSDQGRPSNRSCFAGEDSGNTRQRIATSRESLCKNRIKRLPPGTYELHRGTENRRSSQAER